MADYSPYNTREHGDNPQNSADLMARAEGRYFRRIIRKDKGKRLTRAETEILVTLFNLWMYHRNGPKGYIHPSREKLAKKCKCSVVTVARAFSEFRKLGIAVPRDPNLKAGQGKANRYSLDLSKIQELFEPSNVRVLPGVLVPLWRQNDPLSGPQNDTLNPYQNDTLSIETVICRFPVKGEGVE